MDGSSTKINGNPDTSVWGQVMGTPFSWGTGSVDACNNAYLGSGPGAPGNISVAYDANGNRVNDSLGNEAFQCVELIDRYDQQRWHDNYTWGDAYTDFKNHPSRFAEETNGQATEIQAGDILIWPIGPYDPESGHIAIIASTTTSNGIVTSITTLEQNFYFSSSYGDQSTRTIPVSYSNGMYSMGTSYMVNGWTGTMDKPTGWLHNTLSPDGHDVYAIAADHHLYDYQSKDGVGSSWSAPTEVSSLSFQGSPSSLDDGGVHYVFAISTGGDLYQFVKTTPTGSWQTTDVTNGRDTFQGSPDAYTFTDTSVNPALNHVDINLVDTSGQLVNLDYFFNGAINWTYTQVTTGASLSGSPSGYAVPGSSSYYQLVYVRSGGQIAEYENYLSGSTYTWKYVQALSLSGANATGSPSAFTYTGTYNNSTYTEHSVFVIGDNGHLYVLHYVYPLGWQQQDISLHDSGLSTPLMVEGSSPSADLSNGTTFFVYATSQNGHIYEFYANDNTQATGQPADTGAWTGADLGVDGTLSVTGSPWGYTYTPQGGGLSHIVFFSESDGNLYEKYYQYPAGWQFVALNHPSGTSMNGASPNGFYYGG